MDTSSDQKIITGDVYVGQNGTVTISQEIGLSKADFEELLRVREQDLSKLYEARERLTAQECQRLEQSLAQTKSSMANSSAQFTSQIKDLQQTLVDLGGDKIQAYQQARSINDTALAEVYLKQSLAQLAETHAMQAYRAATLAIERFDFEGGLKHSRMAVYLQPDNVQYLLGLATHALRSGLLDEASDSFAAAAAAAPLNMNLLRMGFFIPPDYHRLDFAEFLINYRPSDERASQILCAYVPFLDALDATAPYATERIRKLCMQAGIEVAASSVSPTADSEGIDVDNRVDAKSECERQLAMIKNEVPIDPFRVGIAHINLGGALAKSGDYDGTEQAWHGARLALGEDHPFVLNSIDNFAKHAENAGDLDVALRWRERALELAVLHVAPFSTQAVNIRQSIAQTAIELGRPGRALTCLRELLAAADDRKIEHWTPSDYDGLRTSIQTLEELEKGAAPALGVPPDTRRGGWFKSVFGRFGGR
ncbi:hypothetical protein SAMN05192549_115159 [Duganella sacchari]|uniref:Tetratricopeptide repeat-containing protein n=1 Tax=Duganella sacchari TaxID=551987 RepID=A0A1M7RAF8_9BURK|nr:tetratricopeptide repeat protein [Duganella sacchari]SHN43028.1 hypothetical protein SAMN05192549_115159 [Duganella sacchari]